MSESFRNDQENISPEEWLRRTRKVLERISIESEEGVEKKEDVDE